MSQFIYSILPNPKRPVVYIDPKLTIAKCVERMVDEEIGALVVHDGEKLLGIVSERDVLRGCVRRVLDPSVATANDIVYRQVSILDTHDSVETAMKTITSTKRRHILDKDNEEIIAILSIGDLLFHLLDDQTRVIEHLENYIHN